jgi:hypothetical protein
MIKPFTLITMLLAAGSGAYLFGVKHRAQTLDDQLASVNKAAQTDAQRITVLQAQWAQETDPTRLTALARQFSTLQPMKPAQLVTVAALRMVLPPAGRPPAGSPPAGSPPAASLPAVVPAVPAGPAAVPAPDVVSMAASSAPQAVGSASLQPVLPAVSVLPPPPAPGPVAAPPAAQPRAVRVAAKPVGHSVLRLGQTRAAQNLPPPRPLYAPHPALPTQFAAVRQAAALAATPVSDMSGSVLGMAADMAPPQPLPQGVGN